MKILKDIPAIILILTLLVASGCVSQVTLLGSPNFVNENITRLIELEDTYSGLGVAINLLADFGLDLSPILDQLKVLNDLYWVYRSAADTYLASGDKDRLVQAYARMEQTTTKIEALVDVFMGTLEQQEPKEWPNGFKF